MRVLMVEDNAAFASVVIDQFLGEHDVTVVTTVAEALEQSTDLFEAVLVDYDLPDGKGDAVVRALRRCAPDLIIIAISSHAQGNAALTSAGAHAVCPKRDFDQIAAVIEAATASGS